MPSPNTLIYLRLRETLTDEEIVESYLFNDDSLSPEEQARAEAEFRALRMAQLAAMTDAKKMFGRPMSTKIRLREAFAAIDRQIRQQTGHRPS